MATISAIRDDELRALLGTFSHDLRNPLAAIVTNVEFARKLVSRDAGNPDMQEAMDDTAAACDVLRQIVANLDVLAQPRSTTSSLRETPVASVVQEVLNRCRTRATQAEIELTAQLLDTHCSAMVDRTLLALSLENLVANALQHAPAGSTVEVSLQREDEWATIEVSDAGPIVPAELRERAVSAAGQTRQRRAPGTRYGRGLALLTARIAAEANGAQLVLGGDERRSCFTLRLPMLPS